MKKRAHLFMRAKYKAFLCKAVMHRKAYIYIDDCRIEKELAESCIGGIHLDCLSWCYSNTLSAKPLKAMKIHSEGRSRNVLTPIIIFLLLNHANE